LVAVLLQALSEDKTKSAKIGLICSR
jgi:hypothetical protein